MYDYDFGYSDYSYGEFASWDSYEYATDTILDNNAYTSAVYDETNAAFDDYIMS